MIRYALPGLICFMFTLGGWAQSHNLVVFSANGKCFILTINDTPVNTVAQANVKAYDLAPGIQQLKIKFRENMDSSDFQSSISISNDEKYRDKEFTYAIIDNGNTSKTRYTLKFITVNDTSGPQIPLLPEAPKEVPLVNNNTYGILYEVKNNKPIFFVNYDKTAKTCIQSLSDKDMKYMVYLMDKTNDLERRDWYVMQTIQNNCYTTVQLKQMLSFLSVELDRLNACKEGYWHLVDKRNALDIKEALVYKSLQEEYISYLDELKDIARQQIQVCSNAISTEECMKVMTTIKAAVYENEKLKTAKKQLTGRCFNNEQLKQITALFTHDRERFEFLRMAYRVATEKNDYYKLTEVFQFSETKQEFNKLYAK